MQVCHHGGAGQGLWLEKEQAIVYIFTCNRTLSLECYIKNVFFSISWKRDNVRVCVPVINCAPLDFFVSDYMFISRDVG